MNLPSNNIFLTQIPFLCWLRTPGAAPPGPAALQPLIPNPRAPWWPNAIVLVEPHPTGLNPWIQPVQILLLRIPALNIPTQPGAVYWGCPRSRHAGTDMDFKQDWLQSWTLEATFALQAQPVFYPLNKPWATNFSWEMLWEALLKPRWEDLQSPCGALTASFASWGHISVWTQI